MKRLLVLLALAGCDAPESFVWAPDIQLTTPLVTGGTAQIRGFGHAYAATSLNPHVATAVYGETTRTEGNDAPFERYTYTERFITVTG